MCDESKCDIEPIKSVVDVFLCQHHSELFESGELLILKDGRTIGK